MKTIILLGVYLMSIVVIFMMMSLVGLVFFDMSYLEILRTPAWIAVYGVFFGTWMPVFPAKEYYLKHEAYFDKVF